MRKGIQRRDFLKTAGVAGAVLGCGVWSGLPAAESKSPNEKLNIAGVGAGGMGGNDLGMCSADPSAKIVALADIDDKILDRAAAKYAGAAKYNDFREMLEKEANRIDAVVVGTPDHIHAPASVAAMKLGKHCFCEKPLAHNVYEVRRMTELAREKKLATQMGTLIHATSNYRRVVELARSGAIGPIGEVHVWCGKGWGGGERPKDTPPVPSNIHWDLWLGPAPNRPYHPCYLPANWRRWWDFGNGTLGDMACHLMDLPYWALDLKHPLSVEAQGPAVHPETCPLALVVHYEYPARGNQPAVKLTWYDGSNRPPLLKEKGLPELGMGVLFVGSEGMILADYGRCELYPKEKFANFKRPAPSIPESIGHHKEWIAACKGQGVALCNFDYAGPLSEAVLLGTVAYRVGKKLQWDPAALKATNCPEADKYLKREYRPGWTL
jgi:predicted dehydrogenase